MIPIEYMDYIKPELLILIPVLLAIGLFLKSAAFINNRFIPLTLGGAGVLLAALWVLASSSPVNWATAVFTSVVQGVLCAAAAVYGHQMVKQLGSSETKNASEVNSDK